MVHDVATQTVREAAAAPKAAQTVAPKAVSPIAIVTAPVSPPSWVGLWEEPSFRQGWCLKEWSVMEHDEDDPLPLTLKSGYLHFFDGDLHHYGRLRKDGNLLWWIDEDPVSPPEGKPAEYWRRIPDVSALARRPSAAFLRHFDHG